MRETFQHPIYRSIEHISSFSVNNRTKNGAQIYRFSDYRPITFVDVKYFRKWIVISYLNRSCFQIRKQLFKFSYTAEENIASLENGEAKIHWKVTNF